MHKKAVVPEASGTTAFLFLFGEVRNLARKRVLYRLLHILLVLIGVSFLSFLLMYAAPGDPVRAMYAVSGSIPPEEVLEQTREEMGLNDPFLVQYVRWVAGCLRGDFGTSYSQGIAVSDLLLERVGPTVQLALLSLMMMVALAVPIGIFSALRQNTLLDYLLRGITFVGISMPNFWVGLLLLYVVAMKLHLLPVVSTQMNFQRLILPALTLALAMAGKYARRCGPPFWRSCGRTMWRAPGPGGCRNGAFSGVTCFPTRCSPSSPCWACPWAPCWEGQQWWRSSFPTLPWAAWPSTPSPPWTIP